MKVDLCHERHCAIPFESLLTVVCAMIPLFMGLTACLAYMFIDLERYEVDRGHKAVHKPLKGQASRGPNHGSDRA